MLRAVCELLAEPDRVHKGFESWIRRERSGARGEPGEEGSWLERLAEIEHARGRYQAMTARGLLTFDELGARLDELEASRRITLGQLRAVRGRQEEVERLERERDEVLEVCADAPAGALAALQPEERHRIYSKLGLVVLVGQEGGLRVSGIPGTVTLGLDEP